MHSSGFDHPPLRIGFCDFWAGFNASNFFVTRLLSQTHNVTIDNRSPQLLFYSVFGIRNLAYRGPKVLVNGEAHSLHHGRPDFSIGYLDGVDDRTFRLPNWAWNLDESLLISSSLRVQDRGEKFANFVYSNRSCEFRNLFFSALNRRSSVESLGAVHPNTTSRISPRGDSNWRGSKVDVLQEYRFTLAMENVRQPGYSTEKITDAFLAGSIPIYWGDPFIAEDFDPRTFIDISSFRTPQDAIEHILQVEASKDSQDEMRRHAPMTQVAWDRYSPQTVREFLTRIVEDLPPRRSIRRTLSDRFAGAVIRFAMRLKES